MNSYAETIAVEDFILTVDTVDISVKYKWEQIFTILKTLKPILRAV